MALGLWRLRFDVEVLNLLPPESPVVQGLKLYQQNFANARELVITVGAPDADLAESSARAIAQALRARPDLIAEATWTAPWLERPSQAAELMAYLWLNQPPALFAQLTNRLAGENLAGVLRASREALATSLSPNELALRGYDPLGLMQLPESARASAPSMGSGTEFFAAADGTFRVVFAESATDLASYKNCTRWLAEVRHWIEATRSPAEFPANVTVRYTGRPAFVAEIGSGMERDLAGPSAGTLVVIALLFYFSHRRWRPLLWLLALLLAILAGTLALGGLVYGTLSVVSLGFASILVGLAEDFGIVLYQEAQSHPHLALHEICREAAPGIYWSALTTAGAFLLLNFSGLPGLGQLGTLVAIGVALSAVIMLYAYLPPLLRAERRGRSRVAAGVPPGGTGATVLTTLKNLVPDPGGKMPPSTAGGRLPRRRGANRLS
jgi:predicted RND superfamily exporter protein